MSFAPEGAVLYCSDQTHPAVLRACHVLGLGDALRLLPSTGHRIDRDRVRREVVADRRAGRRPFLVPANAGATNTGSVDPCPNWPACAANTTSGCTSTARTAPRPR